MEGKKEHIKLTKDKDCIMFDFVIPTNEGEIYAGYFKRSTQSENEEVNAASTPEGTTMSWTTAHNLTGHQGDEDTAKIAKYMN